VSEHPCFEVTVGVDYSSDVHQVMAILKKVDSQPAVLKVQVPYSIYRFWRLLLNFSWSEELFRVENIKSDIESKYLNYLKKTAFIPFPQRVVHLNK
jgi:small-conductance mechanosensitive channel